MVILQTLYSDLRSQKELDRSVLAWIFKHKAPDENVDNFESTDISRADLQLFIGLVFSTNNIIHRQSSWITLSPYTSTCLFWVALVQKGLFKSL